MTPFDNNLKHFVDIPFGEHQRLAEQGDAEAQTKLAEIYLFSTERKDPSKAEKWLEQAAAQGHMGALLHLLVILEERGDSARARECLFKAKNITEAKSSCYHIGSFLLNLPGPEPSAAAKYLRLGIELGDDYCAWMLAQLYEEGRGVPKDLKRARELWEHAYYAAEDNEGSELTLYSALNLGSTDLRPKAYELDNSYLRALAHLYEEGCTKEGLVIEPDVRFAAELKKILAERESET